MTYQEGPERSAWLQSLVDEQDLNRLIRAVSPEEVADCWCRYQQSGGDDDWWAVEIWMDLLWKNDDFSRKCILALVERAPDDLFEQIGAGPIEYFLADDTASTSLDARVSWIDEQAAQSPRFREALRNIWTWGDQPDDMASRIERAAGVRLKRPHGSNAS